jgi:hypothetical protein
MSDELRLPDDLAACEALLAAKPLAATGIDRDQLLYRSGWAACQVQLAGVNTPPSKGWEQPSTVASGDRAQGGSSREAIRGGIAAWSLASAAIAASLAVVITLQWRPASVRDVAANERGQGRPLATETNRRPTVPPFESVSAVSAAARAGQFDVGIFGLQHRALKNTWADRAEAVALTADSETPAAKTARELLEELLPAKITRPAKIWPWSNSLLGGSI